MAVQNPARTVILTSFREPIAKVMSGIHQICNKNIKNRGEKAQTACTTCDYGKHTSFWNTFITRTVTAYEGISDVLQLSNTMENVQVLSIDTKDITVFFQQLSQQMMEKKSSSSASSNDDDDRITDDKEPITIKNQEQKWNCNFRMPSEMIKSLDYAELIYRNLTLM